MRCLNCNKQLNKYIKENFKCECGQKYILNKDVIYALCPCGETLFHDLNGQKYKCRACLFEFSESDLNSNDINFLYEIYKNKDKKIQCPCGSELDYNPSKETYKCLNCNFNYHSLDLVINTIEIIYKTWQTNNQLRKLGKDDPLTEGTKNDQQKLRMELIPSEVLVGISAVLTHGAEKYEDENWRKGIKYKRVYGALMRHLNAWYIGETHDLDSKLPHLWHAACCLSFLVTYEQHEIYEKFDDRFQYVDSMDIDGITRLIHGGSK